MYCPRPHCGGLLLPTYDRDAPFICVGCSRRFAAEIRATPSTPIAQTRTRPHSQAARLSDLT